MELGGNNAIIGKFIVRGLLTWKDLFVRNNTKNFCFSQHLFDLDYCLADSFFVPFFLIEKGSSFEKRRLITIVIYQNFHSTN